MYKAIYDYNAGDSDEGLWTFVLFVVIHLSIDWLIDNPIDQLIDWLIFRLLTWLIDWSIDRLIDWSTIIF